MAVNIIRKIKISSRMFAICIINTAFITISTIKTITMPIISHFIKAIIFKHMFANKGKVKKSRFFSYAGSWGISRKSSIKYVNPLFLDKPPSPPCFLAKILILTHPFSINFEKINPLSLYFMYGGRPMIVSPPGKYLWHELSKSPHALIFFIPPLQNLGLKVVPHPQQKGGGIYCDRLKSEWSLNKHWWKLM